MSSPSPLSPNFQSDLLEDFKKGSGNQFEKIAASIIHQTVNLESKNINLRKTSDLLLPRLISGEIDVENLDINTGIQP